MTFSLYLWRYVVVCEGKKSLENGWINESIKERTFMLNTWD